MNKKTKEHYKNNPNYIFMNKKAKEHYKNNPNDRPLSKFETKLMSIIGKLEHKLKIMSIKYSISIRLLRSQLKHDSKVKEMFMEMYPQEYRNAINATMEKYGRMPKKKVRKKGIIKSMNLKENIKI